MKNRNLGFQKAFGKNIKKLRVQLKWAQAQLASVSQIDETQISRIENGRQSANLQSVVAIAAALGKQPHTLLDIDYEIEVNTDFSVHHRKIIPAETTNSVRKLAGTNFLNVPRTVAAVTAQCKKLYQVKPSSAATSAVLIKLTVEKILKRTEIGKTGKYTYQLRKKK